MTPRQELFNLKIKHCRLRNSWWRFLPCNWGKLRAIQQRIDELDHEITIKNSVEWDRFHHDYSEYVNLIQEYTTKFRKHDV